MRRLPRRPRSGSHPFLAGKTKLSEIGADDLGAALDVLLPWNLKRRLEEQAPTHFEAPTGMVMPSITRREAHPALHIPRAELFWADAKPLRSLTVSCRHTVFALAGAPGRFRSRANLSWLLEGIVDGR